MMDTSCNFAFDQHAAVLLNACGYTEERIEAYWEDIGGPENGPELDGFPAHSLWTTAADDFDDRFLVVVDGQVVEYGPLEYGPD